VAGLLRAFSPRKLGARRIGDGKRVERIGYCMKVPLGKMQVDCGVFDIGVSQQQLNRAQVGAGFQQMGCVGMATIPAPE